MVDLDTIVVELSDLREGIDNVEDSIGVCHRYLSALVAVNQRIATALEVRNTLEARRMSVSLVVNK